MQVLYVSFADNQLSGMPPIMQSLLVLNMSSNIVTSLELDKLPAGLRLLYLSNNNLVGTVPSFGLPDNLSLLDISHNSLSGALPSSLPQNLSWLDVSDNAVVGDLPSNWSNLPNIAVARLDNNKLGGELPAGWSRWGNSTRNSLQLSVTNTSLHGQIPRSWVQQFCLAALRSCETRVLFEPVHVQPPSQNSHPVPVDSVALGSRLELPAQHASIDVSLGQKIYSFYYNSPESICSIPHAARNVGLLWGVFATVLLMTLICIKIWHRRQQGALAAGALSKLSSLTTRCTQKLPYNQVLKSIAGKLWFFAYDVVWFIYSQVTDARTTHQVFQSGQLTYAYILVAILLLPFAVMFLFVVRISIKICLERMACNTKLQRALTVLVGLMVSPFFFVLFEFALIFHGLGLPLPVWFESFGIVSFAFYRLQSCAETFLNAAPQSVIQSKLYLMGNDPNGIQVYINTRLFLFSMAGSLLSVLKSAAVLVVEPHHYHYSFKVYCRKLVRFDSIIVHSGCASASSASTTQGP